MAARASLAWWGHLRLAILLLPASAASAEILEGRVVSEADGDTLTVLVQQRRERILLAGIDAPERGQPFGQRSKESLSGLTFGKKVRGDWHKRDRYGRVVGKVWAVFPDAPSQDLGCPRTLDAGLAQVTHGLAWRYKKYAGEQSEKDRERYGFAEAEAWGRRAGLWRGPEPVAPWEWRGALKGCYVISQRPGPAAGLSAPGGHRTSAKSGHQSALEGSPP